MNPRAKLLSVIILTQTVCVAVGVWMQHSYLRSSVLRAVRNESWSQIEARADGFLARLDALNDADPGAVPPESERLKKLLGAGYPGWGRLTIVDPQWRIVLQENDQGAAPGASLTPGRQLSWTASADAPGVVGDSARGTLVMPDGQHLVLAHGLPGGQGFLLVHHPIAAIEARAISLLGSLPLIGGMTLLWTSALMGMSVYLILGRRSQASDRQSTQALADTFQRTQNLIRTRDAVIFGLAKLTESRDPNTGDHLDRISAYSTTLASALRHHPKFRREVTPAFVRLIGISSALHDIGKVGIEDRILLKPGPLDDAQRATMQTHATIGGQCLLEIERRLGDSNFLQMARQIAFGHHEHWDGGGYPSGQAGEAIPLAARIVALVDVYDGLFSQRVYKEAFSHERCVSIIRNEAGKQFDPDLVDAWLAVAPKFRALVQRSPTCAPETSQGSSVKPQTAEEPNQDAEAKCLETTQTGPD